MKRLLFTSKGGLGPLYSGAFDSGSIDTFALVDGTPTYRITPRQHWNSQWIWFAIKSKQWANTTPHFLVAKANRFAAPAANENMAVWSTSLDTDTWTKFATQSVGASDIEFYHDSAFPGGTIYIAYIPMYPFSRTQRKMTEWAADARIIDTPSTTDLVVTNLTARDNGDGRTAPALPVYGFNLTNANANTKNKAILTSRNHPSETSGAFQLEGALNWLLGGSVTAEFLLDWFDFYVYPCLNPQGAWGGFFRSSPQTPTNDNNRIWDTTGTNEAVDAIKTAMAADTAGAIEVGLDFHSSNATSAPGYMDAEDHTATLYAAFLARMVALLPSFSYVDDTIATLLMYLWQHTYSAKLSAVIEAMCLTSMTTPSAWKSEGQYAMQALASMLAAGLWTNGPGVGSRNFNGTTDRIDWASVANLGGSPLTISAWLNSDNTTTPANQYLLCMADAAENPGIALNLLTGGRMSFLVNGATPYTPYTATGVITTASWIHWLITFTGSIVSTANTHFYKNGAEQAVTGGNAGASPVTPTGSWSIGGRKNDDTRNADGKIGQVGVWNRVLTAGEFANLAAGYAPDLIASGLQFYFKGNTSSLEASPGGTGTADGTSELTGVGNGPSIIYG